MADSEERKDIVKQWAWLGLAAATFVISLYGFLSGFESRITAVEVVAAGNADDIGFLRGVQSGLQTAVAGAESELRGHLHDHEKLESRVDTLRGRVDNLYKNPESRADPFTGQDGEALRKRIESLESATKQ